MISARDMRPSISERIKPIFALISDRLESSPMDMHKTGMRLSGWRASRASEGLRLMVPRRTSFGAGFSRFLEERRSRMSFRSEALLESGGCVGDS